VASAGADDQHQPLNEGAEQRSHHQPAGSANPADDSPGLISERVTVLDVVGESVSNPNGGEVLAEINNAMMKSGEIKNTQEESPVIFESTLIGGKVDLAEIAGKKLRTSGDEMASLEIKENPNPVNPEISGERQTLRADPEVADNS
jgi:hypothetical protein